MTRAKPLKVALAALVVAAAIVVGLLYATTHPPSGHAPGEPVSAQSSASDQAKAEQAMLELCRHARCYPAGAVHVVLDNGEVGTFDSDYPLPIVSNEVIAVFAGATVFITGRLVRGKLASLQAVDEPSDLHDVLKFAMSQEPGKSETVLKVTNYFDVPFKYRAAMRLPDKPDFVQTLNCPVTGKGGSTEERWSHAIFQLALTDFEVTDSATCK